MVLERLDQCIGCFVPRGQDHGGLDRLAAHRIGHAGHRRFDHGRMGDERAFHLEGSDTVTARLDEVVGAAEEPEVAVLVHPGLVAGVVVAVHHDAGGLFRFEQVAGEKPQVLAFLELEADLAFHAGLADMALLVEDGDVPARGRPADGAGLGRHAGEGADLQAGLGLTVALVDGQAGFFLPGPEHAVV